MQNGQTQNRPKKSCSSKSVFHNVSDRFRMSRIKEFTLFIKTTSTITKECCRSKIFGFWYLTNLNTVQQTSLAFFQFNKYLSIIWNYITMYRTTPSLTTIIMIVINTRIIMYFSHINPFSSNLTKWSNTLKQLVGNSQGIN